MFIIIIERSAGRKKLRITGGCCWFHFGEVNPVMVKHGSKEYVMPLSRYVRHGIRYIAIDDKLHVCMACCINTVYKIAEEEWH